MTVEATVVMNKVVPMKTAISLITGDGKAFFTTFCQVNSFFQKTLLIKIWMTAA